MRAEVTPIAGVLHLEAEVVRDDRGWFTRLYDADELAAVGVATPFVQSSLSANAVAGTLRGLHLQRPPHGEAKLVHCAHGRLWDVAVDLRAESPTFGSWWATELVAGRGDAVFLPEGIAHGFVTLDDDTVVHYQISSRYEPSAAIGVRWDDPDLAIDWPRRPTVMSDRDRQLPSLRQSGLWARPEDRGDDA
ncbi:MAG: dTDP-4-dehydrorhamnose 3,5-epimerase [Acidimicrobiales bacterium]